MRAILGVAIASLAIASTTSTQPAAAAECKKLALVTSLDMTPLPSGRPVVVASIADTPRKMLIDTGGAISSVTQNTVRELNLTKVQNGRGVRGVNGAATNILARLPSLVIGRLQQENALYYVLPENDAAGAAEFDGILGGEFFKQYDADFDFTARRLNLFLQDHCAGEVVYWPAPAVAVVPITLDASNHIKFRVQLDGKTVDAMLDTGASSTTLNLNDARRTFGVDVNAPDVEKVGELTGGYTASIYRRQFKTLAFEGVSIDNPMIMLMPDLMSGAGPAAPRTGSLIGSGRTGLPSLIVGMSTLRQMHVYVAYKERKLYLTTASPQSAAAPAAPSP